jgi:hypothetical protein
VASWAASVKRAWVAFLVGLVSAPVAGPARVSASPSGQPTTVPESGRTGTAAPPGSTAAGPGAPVGSLLASPSFVGRPRSASLSPLHCFIDAEEPENPGSIGGISAMIGTGRIGNCDEPFADAIVGATLKWSFFGWHEMGSSTNGCAARFTCVTTALANCRTGQWMTGAKGTIISFQGGSSSNGTASGVKEIGKCVV